MVGQTPRTLENPQVEKQREAGPDGGAVIALGTAHYRCRWAQSWPRGHGAGYPDLVPQPSSLTWGTALASPHFSAISHVPPIHPLRQLEGLPTGNSCLNPFNCPSWLLGKEPKSLLLLQGLDLVWLMSQAHLQSSQQGDFQLHRHRRNWILVYPVSQTATALLPPSPPPSFPLLVPWDSWLEHRCNSRAPGHWGSHLGITPS